MTREERNAASRQRIEESALREFAAFGYAGASVNEICRNGKISKGILYHYFKDKDALYLHCVQACFDALEAYLRKHMQGSQGDLERYFDARLRFFRANPLYQKLFCDAVLTPQPHLKDEIYERKASLDAFNCACLEEILKRERLRPDLTLQEAVDFYRVYQNFANTNFFPGISGEEELERHHAASKRAIQLFLYGVVAR